MQRTLSALFIAFAIFATALCAASAPYTLIRYRPPDGPDDVRYQYFVGMLRLALRETKADYGPYKLVPASIKISQKRAFELVAQGRYLNLVWSMTNTRREQIALPIRIPLLKGLLGMRVLLVRPQTVPVFDTLSSLRGLTSFIGVQGHDWPDTDILRDNGLKITASSDYSSMFKMVMNGRVDYFPRSIAEVWDEMAHLPAHSLAVSPSPLLVYRAPIYFFVNLNNKTLAMRIRLGLQRAVADGSFERQFLSSAEMRKAVAFLQAGHYRVLRLNNPSLPAKTPLHDKSLWFHLPPTRPKTGYR